MTYHVTARDIVHGKRGSCSQCPVNRAIQRRHPVSFVWVGGMDVTIGLTKYTLPTRVWRWIDRYDAGEAVRPMRFELL